MFSTRQNLHPAGISLELPQARQFRKIALSSSLITKDSDSRWALHKWIPCFHRRPEAVSFHRATLQSIRRLRLTWRSILYPMAEFCLRATRGSSHFQVNRSRERITSRPDWIENSVSTTISLVPTSSTLQRQSNPINSTPN